MQTRLAGVRGESVLQRGMSCEGRRLLAIFIIIGVRRPDLKMLKSCPQGQAGAPDMRCSRGCMDKSQGVSRRWLALSVPLAGVGLVIVFLLLVRSGGYGGAPTSEAQAGVAATPARIAVAPVTDAPSSPPPATSVPAPTTAPTPSEDDIVAVVGGVALSRQELEALLAIDHVMAGLTGQPPASPASVLEQWINTEVVLQRSGVPLDPGMTAARLDAILAQYGQPHSTLMRELAAAQVPDAVFDAYFARLVAADAHLRAQTAATGLSAAALVKAWQRETQISFGPVANAILVASAAPTPLPMSELAATQTVTAEPTVEPTTVAATVATPDLSAPRGVEIGQLAPDFTLPTVEDSELQYSLRNLLGNPTVLIFWTTWCPYCLRQTPVLVAAHREWGEEIQFVGVNVAEDAAAVTPYLAEHAIEYPVLLDRDGATAGAYAVQGYPTTYFLDNSARIVARHVGALTEEQLNSYLQTLRSAD